MRVVLDLDARVTGRISGTVHCDGKLEPEEFEGWLELMRLLESMAAPPDSPPATLRNARGDEVGRC